MSAPTQSKSDKMRARWKERIERVRPARMITIQEAAKQFDLPVETLQTWKMKCDYLAGGKLKTNSKKIFGRKYDFVDPSDVDTAIRNRDNLPTAVSGNYYSLGETADLTSLSEKHVLKNKEKREQLGLKALLLPILSGGRKRRALGFPKILVDDYVAKHGRKPFPKNMDTPIAAAKRIECNVKTVIKWLEDGLLIGARVNSLKRPGPEVWAVDRNSAEEFRSLVKKYTARGVVPHLRQFGHRRQLEQPNAAGDRPGEANPKHLKWNEWYAGGKRKGGMSHQQVADRWFDETEEFVTADAVKKALKRL